MPGAVRREVSQDDFAGAVHAGGSRLSLDGQTLPVITGETVGAGEAVTQVELAGDFLSGTVGASVADPTFAAPALQARYDGCLLVVNSQLDRLEGEPRLTFTVSSVPIPAAGEATVVPAASC